MRTGYNAHQCRRRSMRIHADVSANAALEYDSEVWEGNKAQAAALESVMIGGAKRILGCSSRTCNEAVRGDMMLDSLQGRRDKAKLKWWYKVATMLEHRYSKKLFVQEWNVLNMWYFEKELGDWFEHVLIVLCRSGMS